jgi:hypothetical protein
VRLLSRRSLRNTPPENPHRTSPKLPARTHRSNSRHGRTLADIGNSHSEELLDIPEGVKVTIKTRNVVVEGEWNRAHVEGTFMANFSQVPE